MATFGMGDNQAQVTYPKTHSIWAVPIFASLLVLPFALADPAVHGSHFLNWVWLDQFASELSAGAWYPRWLSESHGGLGSPVFYFYPPLSFYLAAVFAKLGFSTYASLLCAFWTGFVASGLTMFYWLKGWARYPTVGALAFMGAPYHLTNFYVRGALAEFTATAMIPLVALGLRGIADGKRGAFALTAIAYAALVLSHLPLALLASVFLIAPYVLICSRKQPERLITTAVALLLGLAASAVYLLPALLLDQYRDSPALWEQAVFQPHTWSVWTSEHTHPVRIIVLCVVACLTVPIVFLVRRRSGWGCYAVACCALALAVVPALWRLPLLDSVQFPYRILPLAEFAIVTGMALANSSQMILLTAMSPSIGLGIVLSQVRTPAHYDRIDQLSSYPDVPENLPRGERPYSLPSQWALNLATENRHSRSHDGITVEPVFYFPTWGVRCQDRPTQTFAEKGTSLLAYRGHGCKRSLIKTTAEILGALISAAALLAIVFSEQIRGSLRRSRLFARGAFKRARRVSRGSL